MLILPFCSHFESDLHEGLQGAWVGGMSTVSLSLQSVRSINVAGCCLRSNSVQPSPYTHTQINTEPIMTIKEMLSKNSYRPQRSFLLGRGSWSGSRSESSNLPSSCPCQQPGDLGPGPSYLRPGGLVLWLHHQLPL